MVDIQKNGASKHSPALRPARTPPHDLEAESYLIGAIMVSEEALLTCLSSLAPEDFYSEIHRIIFCACMKVAADGGKVDFATIRPHLDDDAKRAATLVYDSVPTSSSAKQICRDVKGLSEARRCLDLGSRIQEAAFKYPHSDPVEVAALGVERLRSADFQSDAGPYLNEIPEFERMVEDRQANEGVTGIRTGISRMDLELGGLNPGQSYVIAGRPAMGKSLVIGQIAYIAASQGHRVLLQTPEMSKLQYLDRLAHAVAGAHYEKALRGRLQDSQLVDVMRAARAIADLPLFVDDAGEQTALKVRQNILRFKPDLVLVDYIQYMTPADRGASREQQVAQVSRELTALKSDFNIPVVLAAQLNRSLEARQNKRPNLADLRESGQVEQDADAVVFLHRENRYNPKAAEDEIEFICEKWRFGRLWDSLEYLKPGSNWVIGKRGGN